MGWGKSVEVITLMQAFHLEEKMGFDLSFRTRISARAHMFGFVSDFATGMV